MLLEELCVDNLLLDFRVLQLIRSITKPLHQQVPEGPVRKEVLEVVELVALVVRPSSFDILLVNWNVAEDGLLHSVDDVHELIFGVGLPGLGSLLDH